MTVHAGLDRTRRAVEPPNAGAAPLHLGIDPGTVYVTVGRNDAHFEIWERRAEKLLAVLAEVATATVHGRYEEWVHPAGSSVKGVFHTDREPRWISSNTLSAFRRVARGWRHVEYEPYEPASPPARQRARTQRAR